MLFWTVRLCPAPREDLRPSTRKTGFHATLASSWRSNGHLIALLLGRTLADRGRVGSETSSRKTKNLRRKNLCSWTNDAGGCDRALAVQAGHVTVAHAPRALICHAHLAWQNLGYAGEGLGITDRVPGTHLAICA